MSDERKFQYPGHVEPFFTALIISYRQPQMPDRIPTAKRIPAAILAGACFFLPVLTEPPPPLVAKVESWSPRLAEPVRKKPVSHGAQNYRAQTFIQIDASVPTMPPQATGTPPFRAPRKTATGFYVAPLITPAPAVVPDFPPLPPPNPIARLQRKTDHGFSEWHTVTPAPIVAPDLPPQVLATPTAQVQRKTSQGFAEWHTETPPPPVVIVPPFDSWEPHVGTPQWRQPLANVGLFYIGPTLIIPEIPLIQPTTENIITVGAIPVERDSVCDNLNRRLGQL